MDMALNNRPIVLLGIDGATYSLLDPLIREGRLPHLARLKQEGAYGILQSTIHPITPAAWVSMVTGVNPGKHGVYDFRRRREARYDWELVNSRSWNGTPVWSILGEQGSKIGVFNVPMTYPPHPVNGFMVAGISTPPNSKEFIYPSNLAVQFCERFPDYLIEPDAKTNDLDEYFLRNERLLEQRIEALRYVRAEYPDLDFFMPVFIETDRIHHVYWRFLDPAMPDYYHPSATKWREKIATFYQRIDDVLAELWAWVGERQGYILVVSDHGFGPLLRDVYINQWLVDQGYLVLKPGRSPSVEGRFFDQVDWDRTRAYSFGFFGNINLNLRGREPRGSVEPGREAETLKEEIIANLLPLTDLETNQPIVDAIHRKEELYSGIYLDQAPDLLVIMKNYAYMTRDNFDFDSGQFIGPPMQYNRHILPHSGNHRLEGIIMMAGEGIKSGSAINGATILDVAPTVLYLAGSPIPVDLDGRVLLTAFDEAFQVKSPPKYTSSNNKSDVSIKPPKAQLLEKDVQIAILDEEARKFRQLVVEQNMKIRDLEEIIERFKNGRVMRLLGWLQSVRKKW